MADMVLLDTTIVSIFLKVEKIHETRRQQIESYLGGKIALISFVTVAEMLFWAERRQWGEKKRAELDQRLRAYGVLDPSRSTAELWAETRRKCELSGKQVGAHDLWIAAAALEHDLPLVTADGDFDKVPDLTVVPL